MLFVVKWGCRSMAFEGVCVKTQWVILGLLGFLGISGFICFFGFVNFSLLCVCACRYEE